MKREFLKELGLQDDQIDQIMDENGKDVQRVQDKLKAKEAEAEKLNEQLADANKQVQSFKDMNVDEIKAKAQEFENKYNQSQNELKEAREGALLDKAVSAYNVQDIDVVKGLIKRDQLVFKDDNSIVGLDEQMKKLQEEKAFLFKVEDNEEGEKKPKFSTNNNNNGNNDPKPATLAEAVQAAFAKK